MGMAGRESFTPACVVDISAVKCLQKDGELALGWVVAFR